MLDRMPKQELVDAAVAAAFEIQALQADVERLWAQHEREALARKKAPAARLAKDPRQAAKAAIFEIWTQRVGTGDASAWRVSVFAREMYRRFPVTEDPLLIRKWVYAWAKARRTASMSELTGNVSEVNLARWQALPEIFHVLSYVPPDTFRF